ncbi:hypothetical protein Tco_0209827 [Tanacetum coccineum]
MQCTLPTDGMRFVISMVSISLEGFLPSILLLVMIIVAVVIVVVILVVVVVAIVGVVIVVMIIGVFVIVTIIRVVVVVVVGNFSWSRVPKLLGLSHLPWKQLWRFQVAALTISKSLQIPPDH